MDHTSSDFLLTSRLRKKLDQLKETSMERYVTREQRVVVTLNFCHMVGYARYYDTVTIRQLMITEW